MSDYEKKPWYNNKALREEQKEWYAKLKEDGFYDIEGGVEGHLLKGPTPSLRLGYLKGELGRAQWRKFGDVIDDSHEIIDYTNSSKSRYYHLAQLITAQAFRELEDVEMCEVWALHSQGQGERAISTQLDIPRGRIRKHIKVLQDSLRPLLDGRVKQCNHVKEDQ